MVKSFITGTAQGVTDSVKRVTNIMKGRPDPHAEKQAAAQIKQQLLSEKKNTAVNDWSRDLQKDFCNGSEIKYQTGFKPSPDPCASLNTTTSTTSQ